MHAVDTLQYTPVATTNCIELRTIGDFVRPALLFEPAQTAYAIPEVGDHTSLRQNLR
jgi:hypothetical protein